MKLAVFASGGGSNFQAIVEASQTGKLNADVVCCLSDNPNAGVLLRADSLDVPNTLILRDDLQQGSGRLLQYLRSKAVTHIALAGFLKMIPVPLIEAFPNRIVNIHPALLPSFGGKGMFGAHVHNAVLESGVQWTGVTVHVVDKTYDTGPIILQHPVGVHPDDTVATLAQRVLKFEHRIYPAVLQLLSKKRVRVEGRHAKIDGEAPTFPLSYPSPPSH